MSQPQPPPPLTFRKTLPETVTHHPHPHPIPFRPHPSPPTRPIPLRTRPASLTLPKPPILELSRPSPLHPSPQTSPRPPRMVSFSSAITPHSASSVTDDEAASTQLRSLLSHESSSPAGPATWSGRASWDWPWDEDDPADAAVMATGYGGSTGRVRRRGPVVVRSDSSSSSADGATGSLRGTFGREVRVREGRFCRKALPVPRSHSALAEAGVARADGPRPWDMTDVSGKNFASFGLRKEGVGAAFGDGLKGSRHLLGKGLRKVEGRQLGRRKFRFLRKLSVSNMLFRN